MKRVPKFSIVYPRPYPYDLLVCVGATKEEVIKEIKRATKRTVPPDMAVFLTFGERQGRSVMDRDFPIPVLWLKRFDGSRHSYAILQHEVFHIVYAILDFSGIKLTVDSEEAFAYLIQDLTLQILRVFGVKK